MQIHRIAQGQLKNVLRYEPDTGLFYWINVSKYHSEKLNLVAGTRNKKYIIIRINGRGYRAHRLAWLYVYGYTPRLLDHINGNGEDNRIVNLREATQTQNAQNHTKTHNKNGLPVGVRQIPSGKYEVRITANKKQIQLGYFLTISEATSAYWSARRELHDAPCLEASV